MAKFLITGGEGMLAYAIKNNAYFADHTSYGSKDFNLLNFEQMEAVIKRDKPEYLINCAAYTDVTKAETEFEKANAVNGEAIRDLANLSKNYDFKLIQISTDFVFSGKDFFEKHEDDEIDPVNAYGASKAKGETYALDIAKDPLILRVSWLFGPHGKNFISVISELIKTKDEINVVSDQLGKLTYTVDTADVLAKLIERNESGIYHFANEGIASRYFIALEIERILKKYNMGAKSFIKAITAIEYPDKTPRPDYSVLNTNKISFLLGEKPRLWKNALEDFLKR